MWKFLLFGLRIVEQGNMGGCIMANFGGAYFPPNQYLTPVFQAMPAQQRAAYSQDLGQLLFNFSGQSLPTSFFPNWNPFGNFLGGGGTLPGFQGWGF
jgi:hypothetical protein